MAMNDRLRVPGLICIAGIASSVGRDIDFAPLLTHFYESAGLNRSEREGWARP
jgi:hypothetical protein